ncbi:hypothetical protein ACFCZ3_20230 [Cellulosimicrobium cellulans]|uniref:hypothetical protein n=1 Tax=Cellulosimicrobium cellulans TaxID=1710 RepID=UPI0035D694C7
MTTTDHSLFEVSIFDDVPSSMLALTIPLHAEAKAPACQTYSKAGTRPAVALDALLDEQDRVTATRALARAAVRLLAELDPEDARTLFQEFEGIVRDAKYPQLIVETRNDPDECEGHESLAGEHMGESVTCDGACNPTKVLLDPYTREETSVIVEDISTRHTTDEDPDLENGVVEFWYEGGHFDGLVYLSTATERPVRLPDGWEEV